METTLHFSVDSALLKELGEKLVETVHLALSELVKNAYDADATEVEIIFDKNEAGEDRIQINDNGVGMNFQAVNDYWMRIATTNKDKKNVSTVFGRHLTGAKGIGRFSCRRLGQKLTLITNGTEKGNLVGKQKNIQQTKIIFPWTEFEANTDVTDIECKGNKETLPDGITGTRLIIENISEEWGTGGINWLKRQLAVLAANSGAKREGFLNDPGFLVFLDAEDFEGGVRDLREDLINSGWGTLTAHINSKSQAVCELNALGIGKKRVTSSTKFDKLSDIKLEIGIFVDNRDQMRDTSVISKTTLQNILNEWGGVQIRHRGFRVYPYGNDDWLKIDHDRGLRKANPKNELLVFAESLKGVDARTSLLNQLSMKSYVGGVSIGPNALGFEMKASREGFIESTEVSQLKEFVRFAIDWSTILRDYYIRQEAYKASQLANEEFEKIINEKVETNQIVNSALRYIDIEIKSISRDLEPELRRKVESSFTKATEVIRKHNELNKVELAHFRLIASTSTLLLIFSHEVKSLLGLLEQSKNELNLIAKNLDKQNKIKVNSIGESFNDLNLRLEELLQMTSLISVDQTKVLPSQIALKPKMIAVEKVFELITKRYNIEIDHSEVPNNVVIKKIYEAELYSVLLNLISNSIKATIAKGDEKKIKIEASKDGGTIIIIFSDNGVGLKPERFDEVFTPFVSDPDGNLYARLEERINPEDNMIVGKGSGLGLGIVKEIVAAHGGEIKFLTPAKGWSTQIELRLL